MPKRKAAKKETDGLNEKQRVFCRHYVVVRNATEAARLAGYSAKTAGVQGHHNLKKPNIQAMIRRLLRQSEQRLDLDLDKLVSEAGVLATSDVRDFMDGDGIMLPPSQWPAHAARCVQAVETTVTGRGQSRKVVMKVKLWNKVSALVLVADLKHLRGSEVSLGGGWLEVLEKMWERNRPGGTA